MNDFNVMPFGNVLVYGDANEPVFCKKVSNRLDDNFFLTKRTVVETIEKKRTRTHSRTLRHGFDYGTGSDCFVLKDRKINVYYSSKNGSSEIIEIPRNSLPEVKHSLTSSLIEVASTTVYSSKENKEKDTIVLTVHEDKAVLSGKMTRKVRNNVMKLIKRTLKNDSVDYFATNYNYKRLFVDDANPTANKDNPLLQNVNLLALYLKALATPPASKFRKDEEFLKLAPCFTPSDLACFIIELLSSDTIPSALKDAQRKINLLFFKPEELCEELKLKGFQKRANLMPNKVHGSNGMELYKFSNAVVEVLGVLVDKGFIISDKTSLVRLLSPLDDRNAASAIHTQKGGYKSKSYFTRSMQTLLDLMITAYMPKE